VITRLPSGITRRVFGHYSRPARDYTAALLDYPLFERDYPLFERDYSPFERDYSPFERDYCPFERDYSASVGDYSKPFRPNQPSVELNHPSAQSNHLSMRLNWPFHRLKSARVGSDQVAHSQAEAGPPSGRPPKRRNEGGKTWGAMAVGQVFEPTGTTDVAIGCIRARQDSSGRPTAGDGAPAFDFR
jgi:hypothetical protein